MGMSRLAHGLGRKADADGRRVSVFRQARPPPVPRRECARPAQTIMERPDAGQHIDGAGASAEILLPGSREVR
jgi:hypothetical protein